MADCKILLYILAEAYVQQWRKEIHDAHEDFRATPYRSRSVVAPCASSSELELESEELEPQSMESEDSSSAGAGRRAGSGGGLATGFGRARSSSESSDDELSVGAWEMENHRVN